MCGAAGEELHSDVLYLPAKSGFLVPPNLQNVQQFLSLSLKVTFGCGCHTSVT